ncbi:hypothetical protein Tco_0020089 [Tanacetum coccineum]
MMNINQDYPTSSRTLPYFDSNGGGDGGLKGGLDQNFFKPLSSKTPFLSTRGVEVHLTVEIVGIVPMYGDPLEDDVRCQRCNCKWCGYGLREGFCWFCASRDGNSSIDAPNPNSFNDPPNVFTHLPQP